MPKTNLFNKLKSPPGAKDLLPREVVLRQFIQEQLNTLFLFWGYQPIHTPVFEHYDALVAGLGEDLKDKIFKVVDGHGHILALKPDMTTPIARVAASRLKDEPLPIRLSYQANIFRYDAEQHSHKEFSQAGVELIGSGTSAADTESISLAINAFIALGLDNVQVVMGDQGFLNSYLTSLKLSPVQIQEIRRILAKKDHVELADYIRTNDLNCGKELTGLTRWVGKDEVFMAARKLLTDKEALKKLDNLESIYHLLSALGHEQHIRVDLGMSEDFAYYTGIIFDLYLPGFGLRVGRGGRYDQLLAQYDRPLPAVGFAINLEYVQNYLSKEEKVVFELPVPHCLVVMEEKYRAKGMEIAQGLRDQLNRVELEVLERGPEESKSYAVAKNIPFLIRVGKEILITSLDGGLEKKIPVERLGQIIEGELLADDEVLGAKDSRGQGV